jgi:hypothetical protein
MSGENIFLHDMNNSPGFLSGTGIASGQRVKESIKTTAYSLPNFDGGNLITSTDKVSKGRGEGVLDIIPRGSGCRGRVELTSDRTHTS